MQKRTLLVTGAANGIGLATARRFAVAGYRVAMVDLDRDKLDNEVKTLNDEGKEIMGVCCDVTDELQIIEMVGQVVKAYRTIDVLLNNAGLQYISPLEEFPTEKFRQLIDVMLIGPFMLTKQVFPLMKQQRFGRIVNMASINGLIGFAGKAAYNSAKHGIIGLTKVTALEGADFNITANAICPGYVDTELVRNQLSDLAKMRGVSVDRVLEETIYPLIPVKRLLNPEEVARYVFFLSDEESKNITGQAIVIDGGYTAQ